MGAERQPPEVLGVDALAIALMTASWSTPAGSGVWTVMPDTCGSRLSSRISSTIFA